MTEIETILSKPFLHLKDLTILLGSSYRTVKPIWECLNEAFETSTGKGVFKPLGIPTSFVISYCQINPDLMIRQKKTGK